MSTTATLDEFLTIPAPDRAAAAHMLLAATVTTPVTMPTPPDTDLVRHLCASTGPKVVTLAQSTDDPELLATLARHRLRAVRVAAATNPYCPWDAVTSVADELSAANERARELRSTVFNRVAERRPPDDPDAFLLFVRRMSASITVTFDPSRWYPVWRDRHGADPFGFATACVHASGAMWPPSCPMLAKFVADHLDPATDDSVAAATAVAAHTTDPATFAAAVCAAADTMTPALAQMLVACGAATDPATAVVDCNLPISADALELVVGHDSYRTFVRRLGRQPMSARTRSVIDVAAFDVVLDVFEHIFAGAVSTTLVGQLDAKLDAVTDVTVEQLARFAALTNPEEVAHLPVFVEKVTNCTVEELCAADELSVELLEVWCRAHPGAAVSSPLLTHLAEHCADAAHWFGSWVARRHPELIPACCGVPDVAEGVFETLTADQVRDLAPNVTDVELPAPVADRFVAALRSAPDGTLTDDVVAAGTRIVRFASRNELCDWIEWQLDGGPVPPDALVELLGGLSDDTWEFLTMFKDTCDLLYMAAVAAPELRAVVVTKMCPTASELAVSSSASRMLLGVLLTEVVPSAAWPAALTFAATSHQRVDVFVRTVAKLHAASRCAA